MIIFCVTLIVILISIYRYISNRDLWKYGELIPGEKSLPIIGNAHQVGKNPVGKTIFANFFLLFCLINEFCLFT